MGAGAQIVLGAPIPREGQAEPWSGEDNCTTRLGMAMPPGWGQLQGHLLTTCEPSTLHPTAPTWWHTPEGPPKPAHPSHLTPFLELSCGSGLCVCPPDVPTDAHHDKPLGDLFRAAVAELPKAHPIILLTVQAPILLIVLVGQGGPTLTAPVAMDKDPPSPCSPCHHIPIVTPGRSQCPPACWPYSSLGKLFPPLLSLLQGHHIHVPLAVQTGNAGTQG